MSQEQFDEIRGLIKAKRYNDARAILETIPGSKAQQWLAKLDEIAPSLPTPPTLPQTDSTATALNQARQLIQQRNYNEARTILETIEHHPKAKQWLAKLDEIAPDDPFTSGVPKTKVEPVPVIQEIPKQKLPKDKASLQKRGCLWGGSAMFLTVILCAPLATTTSGWLALLAVSIGLVISNWKSSDGKPFARLIQESAGIVFACLIVVAVINARDPKFLNISSQTRSVPTVVSLATSIPQSSPVQRPTLPPTFTPTHDAPTEQTAELIQPTMTPRPTATPDAEEEFYDTHGRGTRSDPFRFSTSEEQTQGFVGNASMGVAKILRNMDSAVENWNMFNAEAGSGREYVLVWVGVRCLLDADEVCDYSPLNFQLVGRRGRVYDAELFVAGNPSPFEGEVYGDGTISGALAFIVDESDTGLLLIYKPNMFLDESYFFETGD